MMRTRRLFLVLGWVAVLIVTATVVWRTRRPKPLYRVTFLPSMSGESTLPHAMNASGRIAAAVRMANGTVRVILWDETGRMGRGLP